MLRLKDGLWDLLIILKQNKNEFTIFPFRSGFW